MAHKVWKGFIHFGLLPIPVALSVGSRDRHMSFNNLHSTCKSQLTQPKFCTTCDKHVPADEIIKGYATGGGFIEITKEELESMAPASEKVMEISDCVKWDDVDPIHLAESYYVIPEPPGVKAYSLLATALRESGRVALAQLSKSNREHLVLIRPKDQGLVLHFLWYANELTQVAEFDNLKQAALAKNEISMAVKLVESLASPFQPETFENQYEKRIATLLASKTDETIQAPTPVKATERSVVDLMSALKGSLDRPRPKRSVEPSPEPSKKKKRAA